ncbi:MAG: ligase-associated DNA damage response DEXH box helicase [Hyphomicrobiaceae bacterium]
MSNRTPKNPKDLQPNSVIGNPCLKSAKASDKHAPTCQDNLLPSQFKNWFRQRGWIPRQHQIALIEHVNEKQPTLLIAPTGAGKTLAGFLPSLIDLATNDDCKRKDTGLHTLYISPLKALAVDVARNLHAPIKEIGLAIKTETRTGDTPSNRRARQRTSPPHILLTTPEQLALLLSHEDSANLFTSLKTVILDELHALARSKRGDLLSLDIAALRRFAPDLTTIGLSATVARPSELQAYLAPQPAPETQSSLANLVVTAGGAKPHVKVMELDQPVPWAGHSARYAIPAIYEQVARHKLSLIFVNTRMQAELIFQDLWRVNDKNLRIALHHGSLDVAQRRKVEAAMATGKLDGVVATSTLDLGIDWGDVDLVVNVGAPKGASRLIQRIGRANHRLDEPSHALLVPGNRFELLECRAALDAANAGVNDVNLARTGAIDVLAQHVFGMACQGAFFPDQLFAEVRSAAPYATLTRKTFDRVIEFVSTGGYALRSYERFARLRKNPDGTLRLAHPKLAQTYRMNVGTIVDTPKIKIRLTSAKASRSQTNAPGRKTTNPPRKAFAGGRILGEVDEGFIEQLKPGDTFSFAGQVVCFESLRETEAYVSRSSDPDPMIPSYIGGKFPLSTHLAERVRAMLADRAYWSKLPEQVADWLELQSQYSFIPSEKDVLIETFPRGKLHYLVAYPFEGRLVHQTLGMLLTRRLNRVAAQPLGFVANDYGLSIWAARDMSELLKSDETNIADLFSQDMLGDDLDAWLSESQLMKRTFRYAAVIAGLIERRHPGKEKSGRQITMSTDLIYDVLRRHDPNHILLEVAWTDAGEGLLDIARLGNFLERIEGHLEHRALGSVSPLSVPLMLEIGKVPVAHTASDDMLRAAAEDLMREVTEQHNKTETD